MILSRITSPRSRQLWPTKPLLSTWMAASHPCSSTRQVQLGCPRGAHLPCNGCIRRSSKRIYAIKRAMEATGGMCACRCIMVPPPSASWPAFSLAWPFR
ncbi:hypothetical protein EMPG_12746 [Blastomyces silverae]|uniref:Uncharacterized protein n=1 Tax=Blastomyces silverae TaxID=2060906 RepID=A0A0H1BSS3_9EURO|nr:hypothetical protein EMPG_12746 [Blastomyces silverae]